MRFVTWLLSTAAGVAVATWLISGIYLTGPHTGQAELKHKLLPLLLVALILGLVSSFVKPVVTFFSIPFIIFTIGLFLLVINALMLMLTASIAGGLGIGFHVQGFWNALWGSIVITVVNWFIDVAVLEDDDRRPGSRSRARSRSRSRQGQG
ncbi:MAG TPA: phage holin family protein [Nocardioides sp.]|uniref:phage holin family protein n=1 Tax=Nocardioides sp. TaxID=35761 RepID=UPI002E381C8F|nr:phage holin family protein [Nocardioides sp.]HEX3930192.1 phage holin family protein [Nocardioides sp.]